MIRLKAVSDCGAKHTASSCAKYMRPILGATVHHNPKLEDKLRIVPVIVDTREMTEEEVEAHKEKQRAQF